jgi:hypothetical protein
MEWGRSDPDPATWSAACRATNSRAVFVDAVLIGPTDPAAIRADPSTAGRKLGCRPPTGLDRFLGDLLDAADKDLAGQP